MTKKILGKEYVYHGHRIRVDVGTVNPNGKTCFHHLIFIDGTLRLVQAPRFPDADFSTEAGARAYGEKVAEWKVDDVPPHVNLRLPKKKKKTQKD